MKSDKDRFVISSKHEVNGSLCIGKHKHVFPDIEDMLKDIAKTGWIKSIHVGYRDTGGSPQRTVQIEKQDDSTLRLTFKLKRTQQCIDVNFGNPTNCDQAVADIKRIVGEQWRGADIIDGVSVATTDAENLLQQDVGGFDDLAFKDDYRPRDAGTVSSGMKLAEKWGAKDGNSRRRR